MATRSTRDNLFVDTCCYDPHFLAAVLRQREPDQVVFGTEAPGSGAHLVNPATGVPGRRRARHAAAASAS